MLARLLRWVLATLALGAVAWLAACWAAGRPGLGVAGALVFVFGHTLVLAAEFVLVAAVHGPDPTPRAGPIELLKAWVGECFTSWRVFCWLQPFRSDLWRDVPGRPGVRGIVFLHGYVCNRGIWNPWLARCHAQGRPCVALNLEPVFSDLDAYVPQVEAAVSQLERSTGLAPLLVCHSMGGLVARAWLAAAPRAAQRVHHIITIGTPHRGTWLARWSPSENARPMRQASAWLDALGVHEAAAASAGVCGFTCFYGHADNIVMPPATATLPGARNLHLRATAHVAMAFHRDVVREVDLALEAPADKPAP